eukprot:SAG11_NODE_10139_length_852_cov_1.086321_1_plen_121_part_10
MPVDLYVGGGEHACLHLLYARFWHQVLHDCGVVSTPEPFAKLVCQGMILGPVEYTAHRCAESGEWVAPARPTAQPVRVEPAEVAKQGERLVLAAAPAVAVEAKAEKMSKSRGNVVNPDEIV